MLLEKLINRLQVENGTPGTPGQDAGVPETEPLKTLPGLDLEAMEYSEHMEHPIDNSADEKKLSHPDGLGRERC